jgi:hypothetical protein
MRHGDRTATLLAMGALLLAGCGSSKSSADVDDSTGTGATAPDGKVPTDAPSYGRPTPCESSEECEEGESCIAPYDPGNGGVGEAVCVEGCIEENDLDLFCMDDAACCGDLRCRQVDGFCEPPVDDGTTDSGSSGATDTASGTSSTTGATGSGSTDSGSTETPTGSGSGSTSTPTGGTDTGTDSQGTTSTTTSG